MTNEEAIETLNWYMPVGDYKAREHFKIATQALEKQIAHKVISIGLSCPAGTFKCQKCGFSFRHKSQYLSDSMNYCSRCGVKLDWSDEND